MEEQITFETSKLLNKTNFDVYTKTMFTEHGDVCERESILGRRVGKYPRLSQCALQRWLREVHNINIGMVYFEYSGFGYWEYRLHYKNISGTETTYELALEEALKQALNLIIGDRNYSIKVLETPHKKWYKQLLQFISFGLYKAPHQYKCKLMNYE